MRLQLRLIDDRTMKSVNVFLTPLESARVLKMIKEDTLLPDRVKAQLEVLSKTTKEEKKNK